MSLTANKTVFIFCEGTGTEPNYFGSIKDLIIEKKLNVKITISPLPKNEEAANFNLRPNAKKRELKKVSEEKEKELKKYEIADEYKAQPVRYVRGAQMRLEDGAYDEVWAVFDKNGHTKHKEAFDLAKVEINGKRVNIAFSSIAFEYWIILHFNQTRIAFLKSQCREGDDILDCGYNIHPRDCKGSSCICGFIKVHGLLPDYTKGMHNLFHILQPNLQTAIDNAAWLRNNLPAADIGKQVYDLNPYVNIDHLVFSLLQLPVDLTWFDNTEVLNIDGISLRIEKINHIVRVRIRNTNIDQRFIFHQGSLLLTNSSGMLHSFGDRQILDDREHIIEFDLNELIDFNPIYVLYKKAEQTYLITDL